MRYAITNGVVEVHENHVVMLAEAAERADEINTARAESAKERALRRLRERAADTNIPRAQVALMRALNRLKIAGKA
jgi:F-type H+-transporting ATPase subunit epsilon